MHHTNVQKSCAWSGMVGVTLFFAAFALAHFIPPPGPSMTPDQVAAMYQQHATGIRIGMLLMMISGMFIAPLVAVITVQMRRIEGVSSVLAFTQLSIGSAGVLFFILPAVFFLITAFRPDRPPEMTLMMNDAAWITAVLTWPPAFMQNLSIGIAVLRDKSANPVFPRWLGFFQFWVCLLFVPATLLEFFKIGPFAWNGVFGFWIPGTVFSIWFIVMLVMLLKAINRQAQESLA